MLRKLIGAGLAALLFAALAAAPELLAQAQLAKSGTYTLRDGWTSTGRAIELGPGHIYWVGEFKGAGQINLQGVRKHYAGDCSAANDIVEGTANPSGYCRFTDQDGDIIFVKFGGRFPAGGPMIGKGEFIGGSGKYKGIRSTQGHSFTCYNVGSAEISCEGEGKYELP